MKFRAFVIFALCGASILGAFRTVAAQPELPAPKEFQATVGEETEILTRGPLHEAFAVAATNDPVEYPIVEQQPPEPIEELLPEHKPAGDNVLWLPGYWAFDDQRDDFIWISGLWRKAPPGRQWVPGYWQEAQGGYRWNPGMWIAAGSDVSYQPEPPKSQERGPSSQRPSGDHFYVPGCWIYKNNKYAWRPGYWVPQQRGWVWVPGRYSHAGNRYVYSDGYWDYKLSNRGQIFAPAYFRNRSYARSGFRFRPNSVISTDYQMLIHLFVHPQLAQFAFGNYYDSRDIGAGYRPWFDYYGTSGRYDPLLNYYDWTYGNNFIGNLRSWNKYFVAHPEYRPRLNLTEQLAFAKNNAGFKHLGQAVLGNTLDQVVSTADPGNFVQVTDSMSREILGVTNQIRGLTGQRLSLETAAEATVNQTLSLPELSVLDAAEDATDIVPSNPLDLRNAIPQTPVNPGGLNPGSVDLPVQVPGLPF